MLKLGVNIDHVATLREARKTYEPNPIDAAKECIAGGADSIVCHLREDRRHIKDADVAALRRAVERLNLEMSIAKDVVDFACNIRPDQATLVPERRMEITTEGGLDVVSNVRKISSVVCKLESCGIAVSLFINPSKKQIDASLKTGARIIELHTGEYANAPSMSAKKRELRILKEACLYARSKGMEVNAGHGLNYINVVDIAHIEGLHELNIGHSIISRAVFVGIKEAVRQMKGLIG
ncbi:MAG: pyridoxine 5'-phosphate synthase [Candidatus Omnitrophica bacterium]|nr:pyridoxine 5'-phosphate synthase [Candidatus Omnitrophota bacterium]MCM8790412.1 pyridoxine 5'-phosphate synthase [Candidatus Omnitrophota bacterium]